MITIKDMELIDRYLNGELSSVELRQFESRMVNDKDFADYVSFAKDLGVSIKHSQREDLKKKLRNISVKYDYEGAGGEVGAATKSKSIWNNYLSIAASVAFLLVSAGAVYYFGFRDKTQEFADNKKQLQIDKYNDSLRNAELDSLANLKGFGFVDTDTLNGSNSKKQPTKISFADAVAKGILEYKFYGAHDQRYFPEEVDADGLHFGKCIVLIVDSKIDSLVILKIESGRQLAPVDTAIQTMLITKDVEIPLYPKLRYAKKLYAMCAEIHDYAPDITTELKYGEMADTALIRLASLIDKKFMQNLVGQDAVWAVANNATLEELIKYRADSNSIELTRKLLNEGGFVTLINPKSGLIPELGNANKEDDTFSIKTSLLYIISGSVAAILLLLAILLLRKNNSQGKREV